MFGLYATLSPMYGEQPHIIGSALPKYQTHCCKFNHQRTTRPTIIHCHCSLCRKNSGTAFATNGFVNTSDFTITKGQERLSEYSFKAGRTRYFCRCCGSPVYSSNSDDKSRIRIRLGIFDTVLLSRYYRIILLRLKLTGSSSKQAYRAMKNMNLVDKAFYSMW